MRLQRTPTMAKRMFYQIGFQHGRDGVRHMAHRKGRRYDSVSANESYANGYRRGVEERYAQTHKVKLDYDNPLNNQLFMPKEDPMPKGGGN